MPPKKKVEPVEQPANNDLQQILDHFGENSAEYRFALMQIEPTKVLHVPSEVSEESIDKLLAAKAEQE